MKKTLKYYQEEAEIYKKLTNLWKRLAIEMLEDSKRQIKIFSLLMFMWFLIGLTWGWIIFG